jgi:flagellar biosynthetic protein FliQ
MGIDEFLNLGRVAVETAMYVSAPVLGLGLLAGLLVSIFQAATQINDGALAFIPKIAAAFAGLVLFGNFMINRLASFTTWVYSQIANLGP